MRNHHVSEFEPLTPWQCHAAKDAVRFTADDGFMPSKYRNAPRRAIRHEMKAAHKKRADRLYGLDD